MAFTVTGFFNNSQMRRSMNSVADTFNQSKRTIVTGAQAMSNSVSSVSRQFTSLRGNISASTSATQKHTAALRQMQAAGISAANMQTQYHRTQGAGGRFTGGYYNVAGIPNTQFSKAELEKITTALNTHAKAQQRVNEAQGQYARGSRSVNEANRRQGVTFSNLLLLMVKFGIALELIMLPSRIIRGFGSIVSAGAEFEQQLANINSLVQTTRERTIELGRELRLIQAAYGASGDVALAAYEAASTMSNKMIEDATKAGIVNEKLGASYTVIAELVELGAKAAKAGATDVEVAMEGILRINRGLTFSIQQTKDAADAMFGAIDKGILTFEKLSPNIGKISGLMDSIFIGDGDRKLRNFQEMMAGVATVSLTLPQEQTFVAMENMMRAFVKPSAQAEKFVKAIKDIGAGDLSLRNISEIGFSGMIDELNETIGPYGELVNRIVDVKKAQGELNTEMEEASLRQTLHNKAIAIMFPNIRGIRAVLSLLGEDYKDYDEILTSILNKELTLDDALKKQIDTMSYQKDVTTALGRAIRDELFLNLRGPLVDILKMINEPLQEIISTDDFRNASFTGKLNQVWDSVFGSFDTWYQGSGRSMVSGFTSQLTQFLTEFLTDPDTLALATDLAANIGTAIAQGIATGLKNSAEKMLIPDFIHRAIIAPPAFVSESEYEKQFPKRYERIYNEKFLADRERKRQEEHQQYLNELNNPNNTRGAGAGGFNITTPLSDINRSRTGTEVDNSISAQWRREYPQYSSARFRELENMIRVSFNDAIYQYRKNDFDFEKLFSDITREEKYRNKIISPTSTPTPTPTSVSIPSSTNIIADKDYNNQLYKDQLLSMIRLNNNLGRSIPIYNEPQKQLDNSEQTSSSNNTINEEDLQRAMELVGSQGQKQINLKIGDITLPTDDKKLLEALAYILEYADVPQEQVGQLQYTMSA